MTPGDLTQGRRRPPETEISDLEPGDYCLRDGVLWVRAPSGDRGRIDDRWSIEEHEDGTISLGPANPGDFYSIRISMNTPAGEKDLWHGFLECGVWREVP